MTRRSHVVPRGFQRYFADGEQILLIDKQTRAARQVGTKDAFVKNRVLTMRVNGVASDELEDEFARIENLALPRLRRIVPGTWPTPQDHRALCVVASLLWARSFGAEELRSRVGSQVAAEHVRDLPNDPEFLRRFRAQYGRDPAASDVESIVRASLRRVEGERQVAVSAIARHYTQGIERFGAMDYDVLEAEPGQEFVTSDSPVLLGLDSELTAVGMHNHIGIERAQAIYMPIRRTVAIRFHRDGAGDQYRLPPRAMAVLNNAMWRNAVRWVACHPTCDWAAACSVDRPN